MPNTTTYQQPAFVGPTLARTSRELREPHAPRHMARGTRLLLGALATLPLASALTGAFLGATSAGFFFGFLAILSFALVGIGFGVAVFGNPRLSALERSFWIASVLVAAPIVLPLYWGAHVWNAPTAPRVHA